MLAAEDNFFVIPSLLFLLEGGEIRLQSNLLQKCSKWQKLDYPELCLDEWLRINQIFVQQEIMNKHMDAKRSTDC